MSITQLPSEGSSTCTIRVWLKSGGLYDESLVNHMLGHASLTSTQVYTQVSHTSLKAIHQQTHPAAQLDEVNQASDSGQEQV
ncbi:MAG: hypothetical protein V3T17_11360 [Pseudomonadales bacterium]